MSNQPKIIGKIKDAHGIKGELFVLIFSKDFFWIDDVEHFYLGDDFTKYEILNIKPHKDGLIVKVQGITDRNQAEAIKGKSFALDPEFFETESGDTIVLSEILDFLVFDNSNNQELGKIVGFSTNNAQDLLQVSDGKISFYVPFVEAFVKKIDYKTRQIYLDLPDGLIEVQQK